MIEKMLPISVVLRVICTQQQHTKFEFAAVTPNMLLIISVYAGMVKPSDKRFLRDKHE